MPHAQLPQEQQMNDALRHERNKQRLGELHPWMRERVALLLVELESDGWKPRIQDAWRSPEDQKKAFDSGHSKLLYGYHNVTGPHGEMESFACDILREDDTVLIAEKEYCIALAYYAHNLGLSTGIAWGFNEAMRKATMDAVYAKDTKANVKISWDPTHVEPAYFWLEKLKIGWRPAMDPPKVTPTRPVMPPAAPPLPTIPADSVLVKREALKELLAHISEIRAQVYGAQETVKRMQG